MSATSLKPVIEKLESLFSSFNQKFYNGELQTPVITVSPDTTKGAYGWCTSWKAWSNLDPDSKTTDISQIKVRYNEKGQPSQRFIGQHATVNVNPENGCVTTVWKTGHDTIRKYTKR